jgi:hypothetical protein
MKGQILDEYVRNYKGRELQLIDLIGPTGAPHHNYWSSNENPDKDRFVTCIYTHDEPDADAEKHETVFWGEAARYAKQLLMDSPRVAVIELRGARVEVDEYNGRFYSRIHVNKPWQVRIHSKRDYGMSFEEALK